MGEVDWGVIEWGSKMVVCSGQKSSALAAADDRLRSFNALLTKSIHCLPYLTLVSYFTNDYSLV